MLRWMKFLEKLILIASIDSIELLQKMSTMKTICHNTRILMAENKIGRTKSDV